ncbi:hypothetical protein EU537_07475 [Candidatus Thorarchaeota archaeon]|nr:MAG: hypothetical protein EU537_07475 [Candidatus Thorarchaeota archaeon]
MHDRERQIHEKLTEIDGIKKGVKQSYVGAPIAFAVGIFMIALYLAYPSIQQYLGMLLLFGIGFIIMGIGGIIDVKWLFPKRLAKAEAEYEAIRNREKEHQSTVE